MWHSIGMVLERYCDRFCGVSGMVLDGLALKWYYVAWYWDDVRWHAIGMVIYGIVLGLY